ncbi:hypothetical protein Syun_022546 [Stephania yunnanensis]|uniref:Uncharacterized protein n=1 Tax=Stephania yunnanensis TaxID=152371 RepID=A0AAP0F9Q1_9MAGN
MSWLRWWPVAFTNATMASSPLFLTKVEEALNRTCPNSGIKARPHIESRSKSLKKDWFIVNDMICGIRHGTSGFCRLDFQHGHRSRGCMGRLSKASTSEPLTVPIEEFDATPTSSRTRTTTADGRGNEAKKKRKVSNDVYIGDQMVAMAQIVANEISKVTSAIRVEHDLRESFINAMAEVHELTDVERAIYGGKIMGRVELMVAFMTLQPGVRLPWLHAMFN